MPQTLVIPLAVSKALHYNPLSFHLLGTVHRFPLMAVSDHYITAIAESDYCLHDFLDLWRAAVGHLLHLLKCSIQNIFAIGIYIKIYTYYYTLY